MFLPWSIVTLSAFLLLLETLIALSFEATLALILRKVKGPAYGIRWIQQAGMWEMFTALCLSRKMKDKALLRNLFYTLLITCVIVAVPSAVRMLFDEAMAEVGSSQEVVSSRQVVSNMAVSSLAGWTFPVRYGTKVEEALEKAINSTMGIPHPVPAKRYLPKISSYEPACDQFDIYAPNKPFLVVPNDGCASVSLLPVQMLSEDLSRMYSVAGSSGRVKVVIPAKASEDSHKLKPNTVMELQVASRVEHDREICLTADTRLNLVEASHTGITSSPTIVLTKCLLKSGKSVVISMSSIRFVAPSSGMFHSVATSIFGIHDELVLAMQGSANNSTLTTLPANDFEVVLVMEVKATSTGTRALLCQWTRQSIAEVPHIVCVYSITTVVITKPMPMDTKISSRLINKGLNPSWSNATTLVTLSYLPQATKDKILFDVPKILDESTAVAHYFASIGGNFVMDWEGSMLYTFFDTFDIVKGYKVPLWLFIFIIGIQVVCFCYLIAIEFKLDVRCRESLYMTLSRELSLRGHQDDTTTTTTWKPRMHRFNPKTLEFEHRFNPETREFEDRCRLIIPTSPPQSSGDDSFYPSETPAGSQDALAAI
ncbi:hypothetical protein BG004_001773 [Podila humilis]|nr:hypothetical protein BG004_001773 [Podila humilis]